MGLVLPHNAEISFTYAFLMHIIFVLVLRQCNSTIEGKKALRLAESFVKIEAKS